MKVAAAKLSPLLKSDVQGLILAEILLVGLLCMVLRIYWQIVQDLFVEKEAPDDSPATND